MSKLRHTLTEGETIRLTLTPMGDIMLERWAPGTQPDVRNMGHSVAALITAPPPPPPKPAPEVVVAVDFVNRRRL